MENVAKAYDVRFVVNISELGEGDPLMQNVRTLCMSNRIFINTRFYHTAKMLFNKFNIQIVSGLVSIASIDSRYFFCR